eukprot:CAMPEP_0178912230 /NCGR_PEP_ID=MMETSP0786-20121207/10143_1 /TAXON_ID=186022 /ORGANISM="Thalassionema frauenfeldii, Strain CCMP 1798" /LENGTH=687 /DNA_ID=CAMNT_0020584781 /DNA_START=28 /DNA_END=2091 /DNA_ORIENTATION=+
MIKKSAIRRKAHAKWRKTHRLCVSKRAPIFQEIAAQYDNFVTRKRRRPSIFSDEPTIENTYPHPDVFFLGETRLNDCFWNPVKKKFPPLSQLGNIDSYDRVSESTSRETSSTEESSVGGLVRKLRKSNISEDSFSSFFSWGSESSGGTHDDESYRSRSSIRNHKGSIRRRFSGETNDDETIESNTSLANPKLLSSARKAVRPSRRSYMSSKFSASNNSVSSFSNRKNIKASDVQLNENNDSVTSFLSVSPKTKKTLIELKNHVDGRVDFPRVDSSQTESSDGMKESIERLRRRVSIHKPEISRNNSNDNRILFLRQDSALSLLTKESFADIFYSDGSKTSVGSAETVRTKGSVYKRASFSKITNDQLSKDSETLEQSGHSKSSHSLRRLSTDLPRSSKVAKRNSIHNLRDRGLIALQNSLATSAAMRPSRKTIRRLSVGSESIDPTGSDDESFSVGSFRSRSNMGHGAKIHSTLKKTMREQGVGKRDDKSFNYGTRQSMVDSLIHDESSSSSNSTNPSYSNEIRQQSFSPQSNNSSSNDSAARLADPTATTQQFQPCRATIRKLKNKSFPEKVGPIFQANNTEETNNDSSSGSLDYSWTDKAIPAETEDQKISDCYDISKPITAEFLRKESFGTTKIEVNLETHIEQSEDELSVESTAAVEVKPSKDAKELSTPDTADNSAFDESCA